MPDFSPIKIIPSLRTHFTRVEGSDDQKYVFVHMLKNSPLRSRENKAVCLTQQQANKEALKMVSNAVLPRSWVNFSIFWARISSNRRTYSVKLQTDHQLKKQTKKRVIIIATLKVYDKRTTQKAEKQHTNHLYEKTGNYGWEIKWFVPFRMGNFRKNKLRFEGM